jgi:hypothetical protein
MKIRPGQLGLFFPTFTNGSVASSGSTGFPGAGIDDFVDVIQGSMSQQILGLKQAILPNTKKAPQVGKVRGFNLFLFILC